MKMWNKLSFAAVLALVLVCGFAPGAWAKVSVFVTIVPQQYIVQQLAGDLAEVNVLVPPGSSPHTYEPSPRQMTALSGADAYFAIGINLENAWLPRIRSANASLRVFGTQRGVKKIPMMAHGHQGEGHHHAVAPGHDEHGEHHHDGEPPHAEHGEHAEHHDGEHHHHGGLDPHIWLDPVRFGQIAKNTCQGLVKIDPANAATYKANLAKLLADLDATNTDIAAMLSSLPEDRRTFLVFHPAWGYFADRYHLHQMAIEAEGKEPGPKETARILDFCKERHIRVIFVQPQFSTRSAQTIANELGGQVVPLNPLAVDWKNNIMRAAEAFKKSLQ